jgi:hypothetical protein
MTLAIVSAKKESRAVPQLQHSGTVLGHREPIHRYHTSSNNR